VLKKYISYYHQWEKQLCAFFKNLNLFNIVFSVTFDQLNSYLLNKCINYFLNLTDPKLLNGSILYLNFKTYYVLLLLEF